MRMLRLRTSKDIKQAIQTAGQQRGMLIPHLPTEAVTTWTPPINAHNSDSHGSSANVFLICARRVITKFEINLMLKDSPFHKNSDRRMTVPAQELHEHLRPANSGRTRTSDKQHALERLLGATTSSARLIVLNDVLEHAHMIKSPLKLLSDMWTQGESQRPLKDTCLRYPSDSSGYWVGGRIPIISNLADIHLLLIIRQPEGDATLADSFARLQSDTYMSSLAVLIREVIYWPLNAESKDIGEAVILAIERYRVPPTPSVESIIGSPVTPATSAVLSPPLSTKRIVDSTGTLADDLADLALSPI